MKLNQLLFVGLFIFGLSLPTLSSSSQSISSVRLEDGPFPVIIYPGVVTKLSATFPRKSKNIFDLEFIEPTEVQVEFIQNGATISAPVRLVNPEFARGTDEQPIPRQGIYVKVPESLHAGEVSIRLLWRGNSSNVMLYRVPETMPKPTVGLIQKTALAIANKAPNIPSPPEVMRTMEIGSANRIMLFPLVENSNAENGIVVSFKQGNVVLQAKTNVKLPDEKNANGMGIRGYEIMIETPLELLPGKAEMEVRLKVQGKLSEVSTTPVTMIDRSSFANANNKLAPVIADIVPKRIGKGQAFQLLVENGLSLQPKPGEVIVVLEKDGYRLRLNPEVNSALSTPSPGFSKRPASDPVRLIIRASTELSGNVKVRILNPAMGETLGLSEPVALEIASEILPPYNVKVGDSSDSDLQPLKIMQAATGSSGSFFDPNLRYMTVQADGLDSNPKFVWLAIEQNGKQLELLQERDIAVTLNTSIIFKIPKQIGAGKAKILIANKGIGAQSAIVSSEVEITKHAK